MKKLNKVASELAQEFDLHGGTDVTGFSLLGHAYEMASASGVGIRFSYQQNPFYIGCSQIRGTVHFPGRYLRQPPLLRLECAL